MALDVRSVGTAGFTPNSAADPMTLTGTAPGMPAGFAAGDLLLCFTYCDFATAGGAANITASAGWTDLSVDAGATGTDNALGRVFWRTAQAGDTVPTVTFTGGTTGTSGAVGMAQIVAVQEADTTAALGESGASASGASNTTQIAMGAGFTVTAGRLTFAYGGKRDDGSAANALSGDLTWAVRGNAATANASDAMMAVQSGSIPAADTAVAAKTLTLSSNTANSVASIGRMFTIKPAGVIPDLVMAPPA